MNHSTFEVDKRGMSHTWEIERLLIHELAHEKGDHLEEAFDDALAEIGAKLSCLKMKNPELFREYAK